MKLKLKLNGKNINIEASGGERLIDLLREELDLVGTKEGCGKGECGACTVLLDGEPVCSCLMLTAQVNGREITTVEGFGAEKLSKIVQDSFEEAGAIQCGYCSPGMIMSSVALLKQNSRPSRDDIKHALAGNLCRCTGYEKIFDAVNNASKKLTKKTG